MPTGYTADVVDGTVTDFRTFALRCARQFGACVLQRDDPMKDEPKHREVSDYYVTRVATAESQYTRANAMTLRDAATEARKEFETKTQMRAESERRARDTRNRLNSMLAEVARWSPPTPDHAGLRDFMVQQLTETRKYDCTVWPEHPPTLRDAAEWLSSFRQSTVDELARARQALAEEEERCRGANKWIDALYASLPHSEAVSA